jgi:cytosine/adenosine deaminase-related metal-dependent hydrolase
LPDFYTKSKRRILPIECKKLHSIAQAFSNAVQAFSIYWPMNLHIQCILQVMTPCTFDLHSFGSFAAGGGATHPILLLIPSRSFGAAAAAAAF